MGLKKPSVSQKGNREQNPFFSTVAKLLSDQKCYIVVTGFSATYMTGHLTGLCLTVTWWKNKMCSLFGHIYILKESPSHGGSSSTLKPSLIVLKDYRTENLQRSCLVPWPCYWTEYSSLQLEGNAQGNLRRNGEQAGLSSLDSSWKWLEWGPSTIAAPGSCRKIQ